MDFVERPSGGSIKRIVDQRAYRLFTAFEAQYVQAFPSDDAPFVPNRDAYAVLLLIQAMAKEGADANPAHEETVARFRVLQLLLANLLGLEEARRPVTVLVSDLHEKGLRTAVTIAAEVVE